MRKHERLKEFPDMEGVPIQIQYPHQVIQQDIWCRSQASRVRARRCSKVNVQVLGLAAAVRDGRLRFGGGRGVALVAERGFGDDPGL